MLFGGWAPLERDSWRCQSLGRSSEDYLFLRWLWQKPCCLCCDNFNHRTTAVITVVIVSGIQNMLRKMPRWVSSYHINLFLISDHFKNNAGVIFMILFMDLINSPTALLSKNYSKAFGDIFPYYNGHGDWSRPETPQIMPFLFLDSSSELGKFHWPLCLPQIRLPFVIELLILTFPSFTAFWELFDFFWKLMRNTFIFVYRLNKLDILC